MTFKLDQLPYELNALEPFISKETLEFHYGKHHQTYVNNLNNLLENHSLQGKSLEEVIVESHKQGLNAIFNNAAQHYNHIEFWNSLKANSSNDIPDNLRTLIIANFDSLEKFREEVIAKGLGVFGSGWIWLAQDGEKLEIIQYSNAANPLIDNKNPLLGCDVWEHSYYIDYRNNRAKFLETWFDNLINWQYVASRLA